VDSSAVVEGAEIVEPVRFEAGVRVKGGRIGPNVTLETGAVAEGCEIRNTVVGSKAVLRNARLHDSIVGAHAHITSMAGSLSVTDHSLVDGTA
jgi:glucose-1-phosphate thymidylyltransferase